MKKWFYRVSSDKNMSRLALVFTILLFLAFYTRAGYFKEHSLSGALQVQVEHLENGNDFVTTEEMRTKILNKFRSEFANVPLNKINLIQIESELQSMDFIKSTDVFIDANNRLNIYIKQREPIIRLFTREGISQYIDRQGSMMPASIHYSPRVLIARAPVSIQRDSLDLKKEGLEKNLYDLSSLIIRDGFLNALIEEISVDDKGEWTMITKMGPGKVYLGTLDQIDQKIIKLKKVYKDILPVQGYSLYHSINLKFDGQVVCSKRA